MDNLKNLQETWNLNKTMGATAQSLSGEELNNIVKLSLKKEQRLVVNYVIKTSVWIFIVLSGFSHLIIIFWGDWLLVSLCAGGLAIYIPFTAVFMKRYKRFFRLECKTQVGEAVDIYEHLKIKKQEIHAFYRFKRLFDVVMIPVCCLVITLWVNQFAFHAHFSEHLIFNITVLLLAVSAFTYVSLQENVTYFKRPLKKIEKAIADIEA